MKFEGKVKSDNDACVEGRRVRVFRERPGQNKKIGGRNADADGKWKLRRSPVGARV